MTKRAQDTARQAGLEFSRVDLPAPPSFADEASIETREHKVEKLLALTRTYLLSRRRRINAWTTEAYLRYIRDFLEAFPQVDLLDPPDNLGDRWLHATLCRHTRGTLTSRRTAVRHLYAALRWAGATDADPFAELMLPSPPPKATLPTFPVGSLPLEKARDLYQALETNKARAIRPFLPALLEHLGTGLNERERYALERCIGEGWTLKRAGEAYPFRAHGCSTSNIRHKLHTGCRKLRHALLQVQPNLREEG